MMLRDHLNLTGTTPLLGRAGVSRSERSLFERVAAKPSRKPRAQTGITLHEGVYAGLLGPQYETPAEVRMLRTLGADAIGMSTVLEAIQARACGLEVAGFSCLTNWAAGIGRRGLDHSEVLATGKAAAADFAPAPGRGRCSNLRADAARAARDLSSSPCSAE